MKRSAILACLLALVAWGCGHDDDPHFDVLVTMLNNGAPVEADLIVIDQDTGMTSIPEDFVGVRMDNKARSDVVVTDTSSFLHDFHLRRYVVTWRHVAGGPPPGSGWDPATLGFEAGTSVVVPVDGFVEFAIMIAPWGMKTGEPFATALATGQEVLMIADIEFIGTRGISSDVEIIVPASISVNFGNFADE